MARTEVVAAAVTSNCLVLIAHRSKDGEVGWEFPGGKVDPAEGAASAVARELREELDVEIEVGSVIAEATDERIRLVLFSATTTDEPRPGPDHDQLRWVGADDLDDVEWLAIDRQFVEPVRALLQGHGER